MKAQEVYFILIATFILVLAWIVFSILDSAVSSTISQTLNVQISSISPTFNTKVIDVLKKRQQVKPMNPEPLADNQASQAAKPVSFILQGPTPTPQRASNSATIQQIVTP